MSDISHTEPDVGSVDTFGEWLTVQEAAFYCAFKGLHRTLKTVRKWAHRSRDQESGTAEIEVRVQDTENGYRWLIGRTSLDSKIAQELDFERRMKLSRTGAHLSAPVPTGANDQTALPPRNYDQLPESTGAHLSAPVPTGADDHTADMLEFLKRQIEQKDRQIDALLERDKETNVLIHGLQHSLTGVINALPGARAEPKQYPAGDNS